jgi:CsoR family transcriptional regulator, copper-sensing transcriptional repressor
MEKDEAVKNINTRLKRIEGQVVGIEKMFNEGACCRDMLVQIAAVRAALNRVGSIVLQNYAKTCVIENQDSIDELIKTLDMFLK